MPEEKKIETPLAPETIPSPSPIKSETLEALLEEKAELRTEKASEKYGQILSSVVAPTVPETEAAVMTDAQSLVPHEDADSTVQKLVALAETKGVAHAVAVAQKFNDLYVLDTMHDELADKFSEALTEKGLIQAV